MVSPYITPKSLNVPTEIFPEENNTRTAFTFDPVTLKRPAPNDCCAASDELEATKLEVNCLERFVNPKSCAIP